MTLLSAALCSGSACDSRSSVRKRLIASALSASVRDVLLGALGAEAGLRLGLAGGDRRVAVAAGLRLGPGGPDRPARC